MIKGLDDDEVEFLDLVDQKKLEMEQVKKSEERLELEDYRKKVQRLKENCLDERMLAEIRPAKLNCGNSGTGIKSSQQQLLLKGVLVKKKGLQEKSLSRKTAMADGGSVSQADISTECCSGGGGGVKRKATLAAEEQPESKLHVSQGKAVGLTCVGILPGLASCYGAESSDESDQSTCDDDEQDSPRTKYDLMGRKIIFKTKEKTS